MHNPLVPPPSVMVQPPVAPNLRVSPFQTTDIPEAAPSVAAVTDIDMPLDSEVTVRDFTKFDSKLEVINGDPNLDYRWVNSDMQRYSKLFAEGYRPVRGEGRARSEVAGADGPELFAGTQGDGAARRAILMARHKKFRVKRDETYRKLVTDNQRALDPTVYQGNQASDADSFTGSINIGGGRNG